MSTSRSTNDSYSSSTVTKGGVKTVTTIDNGKKTVTVTENGVTTTTESTTDTKDGSEDQKRELIIYHQPTGVQNATLVFSIFNSVLLMFIIVFIFYKNRLKPNY
jgi:hypothetical protein